MGAAQSQNLQRDSLRVDSLMAQKQLTDRQLNLVIEACSRMIAISPVDDVSQGHFNQLNSAIESGDPLKVCDAATCIFTWSGRVCNDKEPMYQSLRNVESLRRYYESVLAQR